MKRCGDEQERIKHWTRVEAERELLANRTERGLIGAAVALKGFQLSGQFPRFALAIGSENSSLPSVRFFRKKPKDQDTVLFDTMQSILYVRIYKWSRDCV